MFSGEQAESVFRSEMDQAVASGRWMAAVWKVVDEKIVLQNVTTYNFPDGDFLPAVGQLALKCHEETIEKNRPTLPKTPLPRAFPPRMHDHFEIRLEDDGSGADGAQGETEEKENPKQEEKGE